MSQRVVTTGAPAVDVLLQVLQDIRGTQDVDEEFTDICNACVEANKVWHPIILTLPVQLCCSSQALSCAHLLYSAVLANSPQDLDPAYHLL